MMITGINRLGLAEIDGASDWPVYTYSGSFNPILIEDQRRASIDASDR